MTKSADPDQFSRNRVKDVTKFVFSFVFFMKNIYIYFTLSGTILKNLTECIYTDTVEPPWIVTPL